jgi:hypothetical protein
MTDLVGDDLQAVRYAVAEMVALRTIGGKPIPKAVLAVHHQLSTSVVESEIDTRREESTVDDLIGTRESAMILRCSTAWVWQI